MCVQTSYAVSFLTFLVVFNVTKQSRTTKQIFRVLINAFHTPRVHLRHVVQLSLH